MNPLPDEAQGLEGEAAVATQVVPSGAVAITIARADFGITPAASARPQGAGGVTTAHHHPKVGPRLAQGWEGVRRPLAITKEASGSTILTPRGCSHSECSPSECSHSGLRVRRLRVDCSKLCFSPIGAVLVICCFSLVICVAQILSPPPFGINTGANGAECNATGFGPMPVCICVPPSATRSSSTLRLLGNSLCYPLWTCPNPDLVLPINPDLPRAQARVRQSVSRTS